MKGSTMTEYIEASVLEEQGPDQFLILRKVLNPEFAQLSDSEIAILLDQILGRMSPEEVEGFWDTLNKVGRAVGGVAKQVAPTALPIAGTALGAYLGGPMGAQIGSRLGQMGGQIIGGRKPSAPVGPQRPSVSPVAPPLPPRATSTVNQLMALIQNPLFLKSLLGQVLGSAGRQSVPVGPQGATAPFGAFMNALGSLASMAASEAQVDDESVEAFAYLQDEEGNFLVDPANPDERAQRLLEILSEAQQDEADECEGFDPVSNWLYKSGFVR